MKLYFSPGACSMASHMVLNESGLKYSVEQVDLATHTFHGKDFRKINPKGYVPALELDDGSVLTEGVAIMQYVADQAPQKNLVPKNGTIERYRCQEWLNYVATEIHKSFGILWNKQIPDSTKAIIKETLSKKFDFLSTELSGKKFLMGDQFTAPDAYLFTVLSWSQPLKLDLTKWPVLLGYLEKVKSRPATMETLKGEGLLPE